MADAPFPPPPDPLASCRTAADLLEHLGGIPAGRVWLRPAPGTATEQDVIEADARPDRTHAAEPLPRRPTRSGLIQVGE